MQDVSWGPSSIHYLSVMDDAGRYHILVFRLPELGFGPKYEGCAIHGAHGCPGHSFAEWQELVDQRVTIHERAAS